MIDYDGLAPILKRVNELREPELVLLNGHLLIERLLVTVVASRLNCDESELPRFRFGTLAEIAFREDAERRPVLWLNDLRNTLAHEFDALESEPFANLVGHFGFAWPKGTLERATVLQLIVYDVQQRALRRLVDELEWVNEPPWLAWDESDKDELRDWANSISQLVQSAQELADNGKWDELIAVLKPGWRRN